MAAKRPASNVALVKQMMEFSPHGALARRFIIDAITKHAAEVAASTPADYPENGFIYPEAWIAVAQSVKQQLDEFYGRTA